MISSPNEDLRTPIFLNKRQAKAYDKTRAGLEESAETAHKRPIFEKAIFLRPNTINLNNNNFV